MSNSDLYKRDLYVTKQYDYIRNVNVVEYDIRSAGLNVLRHYGKISQYDYDRLSKMEKIVRNVKIGLLERKDKSIAKCKSEGIKEFRKKFFEANNIEDSTVIAIRKDAIFLLNPKVKETKFGDYVEFVPKNSYSSYYQINNFDLLYNSMEDKLDIKGVKITPEIEKLHKDYFLKFLKTVIRYNETDNRNACEYLYDYANKYRKKQLPIGNYRELNAESLFRLKSTKMWSKDLGVIDTQTLEGIDIRYNYNVYLMKINRLIN